MTNQADLVISRPVIITLPAGASQYDLDSCLARSRVDDGEGSPIYVLRVDSELWRHLSNIVDHDLFKNLILRVSSKPIYLMAFVDEDIEICRIEANGILNLSINEAKSLLESIRQVELKAVFEDNRAACFYPSSKTRHYAAPSRHHCSAFIRLGDAIRSRDSLDRIAFWLQPEIARANAVLVDTWSISSVVLRAMQMQEKRIDFDCLPSHPAGNRIQAEEIIKGLSAKLRPGSHIVCIVSVASSGSLRQKVDEICRILDVSVRYVAVYALKGYPEDLRGFCKLDITPENYPPDDCELCRSGSTVISLHPGLYHMREVPESAVYLSNGMFGKTTVGGTPAHDTNSITSIYASVPGAFKYHVSTPSDYHHEFYVDVAVLIGTQKFIDRFKAKLDVVRGESPEVIVTPSDAVSRELGQIAAEYLDITHVATNSLRKFDAMDEVMEDWLKERTRFLFIDDYFITGKRMMRYLDALRRYYKPDYACFLVGVARPPSRRDWEGQVRTYSMHEWKCELESVEIVYVSNNDEKVCTWCKEYDYLSGVAKQFAEPPVWLTDRIAVLTERAIGVGAPIFLGPGVTSPILGGGSFAGPPGLGIAPTTFSLEAALQNLRHLTDEKKRLDPSYPIFTVFNVRNISERYTEAMLAAGFIRLVNSQEWGVGKQLNSLIEHFAVLGSGPDRSTFLGEILLFINRSGGGKSLLNSLDAEFAAAFPGAWEQMKALALES